MSQLLTIRALQPDDLPQFLTLCKAHAAYEKAQWVDDDQMARWKIAFFSDTPALFGWVAEQAGTLYGFMTVTVDYATWPAAYFAHMDCLYIEESQRGQGLGRRFFETLGLFCQQRQYRLIQWQTPADNELGIGFYRRMGATSKPKLRFFLDVECDVTK